MFTFGAWGIIGFILITIGFGVLVGWFMGEVES